MKHITLWLVVFALTAGPWLARTAYYAPSHNPMYPKDFLWMHGEYGASFPWHHVHEDIQQSMRERPLPTLWLSTMDPTGEVDGDQKIGGWGPLFNVLCVPAMIVAVLMSWIKRREGFPVFVLLAAVLVPWACFPHVAMVWSRFVMPWTLAGFISLGSVLKLCERSSES